MKSILLILIGAFAFQGFAEKSNCLSSFDPYSELDEAHDNSISVGCVAGCIAGAVAAPVVGDAMGLIGPTGDAIDAIQMLAVGAGTGAVGGAAGGAFGGVAFGDSFYKTFFSTSFGILGAAVGGVVLSFVTFFAGSVSGDPSLLGDAFFAGVGGGIAGGVMGAFVGANESPTEKELINETVKIEIDRGLAKRGGLDLMIRDAVEEFKNEDGTWNTELIKEHAERHMRNQQ